MNILLLTYSFNYNYGGLLQAYATTKYLEQMGHAVTVPNCHPVHLVGNSSLLRGVGLKQGNPFAAVLRRLRQVRRYARFDQFRRNLPIDGALSSKEAIIKRLPSFDVVLTGSDQTWNTKFMPKYDPYFYQGFFDGVRKVSYASCFGTREQRTELLPQVARDLAKFDALAVRNEVSRQIVRELTNIEPTVVVDPTLLHDFHELRTSGRSPRMKPFVMVYALDTSNFATAEAIIGDLRIRHPTIEVHFVNGEKNFDKPSWATHLINSYGPVEFLEAMQEASYVVTDSFHGLIFAQKFNRPCIAYTSGWRSERIVTMMNDFAASDLLLTDSNPVRVREVVAKVADEGARLRISDALRGKIEHSKVYLSSALGHES